MHRILRQFAKETSGATLVEFALAAPIVLVCVAGLFNVTQRLTATRDLEAANAAGVRYAATSGFDAERIAQLIEGNSYKWPIKASPAPSLTCGCIDENNDFVELECAAGAQQASTNMCYDSGRYVVVNATMTYSDPFSWLPLSDTQNIQMESWTRVE